MRKFTLLVCAAAVAVLGGCSSMSSTFTKDPADGKEYDGFPVVVNRPRYLKVTTRSVVSRLVENSGQTSASGASKPAEGMADLGGGGGGGGAGGGKPPAATSSGRLLEQQFESIKMDYEVITVGEVYTVDFKRPAAGTAEFGMEFEKGAQFPTKISYKADDKTIKELSDAIGNLAEKVIKGINPTSGSTTINFPEGVTTVEVSSSVISVQVFDLDQLSKPGYVPVTLFPPAGHHAK